MLRYLSTRNTGTHRPGQAGGPGRAAGGDRQTVSLLQRRGVRSIPELTTHVGKESYRLEDVEIGLEHNPDEIWIEYRNRSGILGGCWCCQC